jgi:predicted  nucleic acid-binding Zn-ribbon protein
MATGGAGLILRKEAEAGALEAATNHHHNHELNGDNASRTEQKLEQENAMLRKELQETKNAKSLLLERMLRMEKSFAEQQELEREKQQNRQPGVQGAKDEGVVTILLPPSLFMKTYALVRSSSKPLLLRVKAGEAIDIDKTSKPN